MELTSASLTLNIGLFLLSAVVVGVAGTRIATTADRLADMTGLGEALFGAVFLGGSTSLSGIVTSVTAAAENHPELAVSNAMGSIAAQTAFLGLADIAHRKANLEHAAASIGILMQGALLLILLAIPLLAMAAPEPESLWIHPASFVLIAAYIFGLRLVSEAETTPMWRPHYTAETRPDEPEERKSAGPGLAVLWSSFAVLAVIVGGAGYMAAKTGIAISIQTGLSETIVGGLFTAVCTSLAEAITTVAAIRRGALTLGVSNIIGGNCFDVTVVALSDLAYLNGSIYHALTSQQMFLIALTAMLTAILLMGLLRREKHGIANIGLESFLILMSYLGAFSFLLLYG